MFFAINKNIAVVIAEIRNYLLDSVIQTDLSQTMYQVCAMTLNYVLLFSNSTPQLRMYA